MIPMTYVPISGDQTPESRREKYNLLMRQADACLLPQVAQYSKAIHEFARSTFGECLSHGDASSQRSISLAKTFDTGLALLERGMSLVVRHNTPPPELIDSIGLLKFVQEEMYGLAQMYGATTAQPLPDVELIPSSPAEPTINDSLPPSLDAPPPLAQYLVEKGSKRFDECITALRDHRLDAVARELSHLIYTRDAVERCVVRANNEAVMCSSKFLSALYGLFIDEVKISIRHEMERGQINRREMERHGISLDQILAND